MGTGSAQVLSLLLLPILGRLYTPGDFGLYGVFIATVGSLSLLINGGYEAAIMLPKELAEARGLLRLSILLAIGVSGIIGLFFWLGGKWFWAWWEAEALLPYQGLLILTVLLTGMAQPLRIILNRLKHYRLLAIARFGQAIVVGGVAVSWGYWLGSFNG